MSPPKMSPPKMSLNKCPRKKCPRQECFLLKFPPWEYISRKSVLAEERNWERIIPSASLERGKVRCLRQNVSLNHISCYFSCQHCVSSWKVGVWNKTLDLWIIESTRYSDQFQLVSLDRSFFFFFFFLLFFLISFFFAHKMTPSF